MRLDKTQRSLILQVVGVLKVQDNTVILKVWDGTMPSHKVAPGTYPEVSLVNCVFLICCSQVRQPLERSRQIILWN